MVEEMEFEHSDWWIAWRIISSIVISIKVKIARVWPKFQFEFGLDWLIDKRNKSLLDLKLLFEKRSLIEKELWNE